MSTQDNVVAGRSSGILFVVATPIGNREDVSRRAERILSEVDCIFCEDTRHSGRLLNELGIDTPRMSLHEHNERARIDMVIKRLRRGESCALISDAGTPLINDPGFILVRALREAGLRVVPVPGASAIVAALSAAGLPTDRFSYEGFLPARPGPRREKLQALATDPRTLVFYEAPHRVSEMLADASSSFGAERKGCVAREITKVHEEFRCGSLRELHEWTLSDSNATRGEIVVMIAGADSSARIGPIDVDSLLRALLEELPASKAAKVASRLTGDKRQLLYQRALTLSGEPNE